MYCITHMISNKDNGTVYLIPEMNYCIEILLVNFTIHPNYIVSEFINIHCTCIVNGNKHYAMMIEVQFILHNNNLFKIKISTRTSIMYWYTSAKQFNS